ncbi:YhjD/YihY/BrkB family envelope integrity protein [Nocardioides lentus]|uniref:YhjD/YihY/BrkB family envelope integrity protein n=1 Tax=Nocardioides lentus TaxID=338077 RepID=A0ABP5A8D6_9ACTN
MSPARWRAETVALVHDTRRLLVGRDLGAAAATLTYYSGIAIVPWLLLGLWSISWWYGADGAEERLLQLQVLVPPDMGGREPFALLIAAGTHLGLVGALVSLFPASFYGEGLRRAGLALAPQPDHFTGWRGRALVMAPVVLLPTLTWAVFASGSQLTSLTPEGGGGGPLDLVVRIYLTLNVVWVVISLPLTWAFRFVVPGRPRWWVATAGGFTTGAFLAGFLQGFLLFLSIPIDVGIPFGGLTVVGGVVAVGLWLWVLHAVLLVGWVATSALERRVADTRHTEWGAPVSTP